MRSRTLLVAGIGAALITLAGCGGGTVTGSAQPAGAGGGAPAGQSQKISTVADLGALVQHKASQNSAHMSMDMNVGGMGSITASGDMKLAGAQSAVHMTMSIPQVGDMEIIVLGTTTYLKLPAGLAGITGGTADPSKPWTKIDLGSSNPLSQSLGSTAGLADQADPTQLISKIAQAGTITSVSHDTADGVATTHYAITVDVQKMIDTMAPGAATSAQKQALQSLGIKSMPFDIWVNSDNLPVKISTEIAVPSAQTGTSAQVQVTVHYSNWGQSVDITPPPADQISGN